MKAINLNKTGSFVVNAPAFGTNFTVDLWFKLNSFTQKNFSSLFMRGNSRSANGVHIYNGKLGVRRVSSSGLGSELENISNLNINNWYRATFVCDGSNFNYYRDGVLISKVSVNGGFSTTSEISIGDWSRNYGSQLDGAIHDFKVFNRNLTNDELTVLFNNKQYDTPFETIKTVQLKLNDLSNLDGATLIGSAIEDVFSKYPIHKTLILSNDNYKTFDGESWSDISKPLNTEVFLDKGMNNTDFERKVQSVPKMQMSNKIGILPADSTARVFSKTLDLKKYMDIRKIEVK